MILEILHNIAGIVFLILAIFVIAIIVGFPMILAALTGDLWYLTLYSLHIVAIVPSHIIEKKRASL
jgi:hypothetical protein